MCNTHGFHSAAAAWLQTHAHTSAHPFLGATALLLQQVHLVEHHKVSHLNLLHLHTAYKREQGATSSSYARMPASEHDPQSNTVPIPVSPRTFSFTAISHFPLAHPCTSGYPMSCRLPPTLKPTAPTHQVVLPMHKPISYKLQVTPHTHTNSAHAPGGLRQAASCRHPPSQAVRQGLDAWQSRQ